jgi:hypothetical protein
VGDLSPLGLLVAHVLADVLVSPDVARTIQMTQPTLFRISPAFDGIDIQHGRDQARLESQLDGIRRYMADGSWRTLQAIADATGYPHASCSAQLRNLRKAKFGSYQIDRRYVDHGLYEYRIREGQ